MRQWFRFSIRFSLGLTLLLAANEVAAQEPPAGPTLKRLVQRHVPEDELNRRRDLAVQITNEHLQPDIGLRRFNRTAEDKPTMLSISWFISGGHVALRYAVTEDGRCGKFRHTTGAYQDNHETRLAQTDLETLKSLVNKLPESKAEPPIERTVLVSFQSGDKWRTETYDAAKLPDEFEKVMLIIGERSETKDRHKKK